MAVARICMLLGWKLLIACLYTWKTSIDVPHLHTPDKVWQGYPGDKTTKKSLPSRIWQNTLTQGWDLRYLSLKFQKKFCVNFKACLQISNIFRFPRVITLTLPSVYKNKQASQRNLYRWIWFGSKLPGDLKIYEPGHEKLCLMSYANNKGADQTAHPRSLISAFVCSLLG